MSTYMGKFQIDNDEILPIGSTLYGKCTSAIDATEKVVTLEEFDELINGITIQVRFMNGNNAPLTNNLKLKVGSTAACTIRNPGGSVTWSEGAVISFTYDYSDNVWIANDGSTTAVAILNTYNPISEDGISGKGVAEALSTLGSAANRNATNFIGNGNQQSTTVLPSVKAVVDYIDGLDLSGSNDEPVTDLDALHYLGQTTTNLTRYPTTNPITIDGISTEASLNDIVRTSDNKIYRWQGQSWELFVDEDSYGIRVYRQNDGYNTDLPLLVSRSDTSSIGSSGVNDSYTNNIYGVIWDDATKTPTVNISTGTLSAKVFSGSGASLVNLNADNLSSGTVPLARLSNSGADAGAYGPTTNLNATYGDSFEIPWVTVDVKGRVTAIAQRTITLPPSDNTDANVVQLETNDDKEYAILMKNSDTLVTETNGTRFATGSKKVTINPSTGTVTATGGFVGLVSEATIAHTAQSVDWTNIANRPILTIAGLAFGLNDANDHTISANDLRIALGLQNALHFIGIMSISNDEIDLPDNYTPAAGDVIIVDNFEYIYIETNPNTHTGYWEKFGDDSSFKLKQQAIVDDPDHTNQSNITFVSHIGQNVHGVISVTKSQLPYAAANAEGIVSTSAQSFSGLKHFLDTIDIKSSANSVQTMYITGTTIKASSTTDANGILYLQPDGGMIYIGENTAASLLMTGNSEFDGNIGIGTAPEDQVSGHIHRVKINGSTLIMSGNVSVAHLDIATNNNTPILQFYPHTTDVGTLGTLDNRWASLYLANEIRMGSANGDDGFVASYLGTLDLQGTTPTINLIGSNNNTWTIGTSGAIITISNGSQGIQGNSQGFKVTDCLYVNENIPANSPQTFYVNGDSTFDGVIINYDDTQSTTLTNGSLILYGGVGIAKNVNIGGKVGIGTTIDTDANDPHQLAIQGSTIIKIKDANSNTIYEVAHLDAALVTSDNSQYGQLSFYPEETGFGFIGTISNRWNSGYFSNVIQVNNNGTTGASLSGSGTLELNSATSAFIRLNDGVINWKISNNLGILSIASLANNNTYISGSSNTGFIISPSLGIGGAITNGYELSVHGTGYISGIASIGTLPQEGITLVVEDYIKLTHENTDIVHLEYSESDDEPTLAFYPDTSDMGSIGTEDYRWGAMYLSDDFNITNPNDNIIDFSAVNGIISIEAETPTLSLNTIDSELTNWWIINDESIFTITDNAESTFIKGFSGLGFAVSPRLYVSEEIDNLGTHNFYVAGANNSLGNIQLYGYTGIGTLSDISRLPNAATHSLLTVQDYIKIVHDGTQAGAIDIAHFRYFEETVGAQTEAHFQVYTRDRLGELGTANYRWHSLYLYEGLTIDDEYNNNGTDIIEINTSSGSTLSLASNLNKALITMNTNTNTDVTLNLTSEIVAYNAVVTLTSTAPAINLATITSGASSWLITNNEGILELSNGDSAYLYVNDYGIQTAEHFYLNAVLDANPDYVFLVEQIIDPETNSPIFGQSKINSKLGIAAEPTSSTSNLTLQDSFSLVHETSQDIVSLAHLKYTNGPQVQFYPETTDRDTIGLANNRWQSLYLTRTLNMEYIVNNTTYSISALITALNGATIDITSPAPKIQLISTALAVPKWTVQNKGSDGLTIENSTSGTNQLYIHGVNNKGFELFPRLYIGASIPNSTSYALYVNGNAYISGGINSSNNIFPTNTRTQDIGLSENMWHHIYGEKIIARFIDAVEPDSTHNYATDGKIYFGNSPDCDWTTCGYEFYCAQDQASGSNMILRINSLGINVTQTTNTNSLVVSAASTFVGHINFAANILPMGNTQSIGKYEVQQDNTIEYKYVNEIYANSLSVDYIDASPAGEINIGFYDTSANSDHCVLPTNTIRFHVFTTTVSEEQMNISASGVSISNDIYVGNNTPLSRTIYYSGASDNQNTLRTQSMIQFLNNAGGGGANTYYGHGIQVGSEGSTIISAGNTILNAITSIVANNGYIPQVYIEADQDIILEAGSGAAGGAGARNGIQITNGATYPLDPSDNNGITSLTLGTSSHRWAKVYIGTSDNHGSMIAPIYWNDGVPTQIRGPIGSKEYGIYVRGDGAHSGELDACACFLRVNVDSAVYTTSASIPASDPEEEPETITTTHYYNNRLPYYVIEYENPLTPAGTDPTPNNSIQLIRASNIINDGNSLKNIYSLEMRGSPCTYLNNTTFPSINWSAEDQLTYHGLDDTYVLDQSKVSLFYKVTSTKANELFFNFIDFDTDQPGYLSVGSSGIAKLYIDSKTGNISSPNADAMLRINSVYKIPWSLAADDMSVTIETTENDIFTANSIITQIVVTSGVEYLNAPITWISRSNTLVLNTNIAVTGDVSGYIIVARGITIDTTDERFTWTTSTDIGY